MRTAAAPHFGPAGQTMLVTGATGFVGRRLVAALLADGQHVIALTRDAAKAQRVLGDTVRCIGSMAALPLGERVDVVVNLAGARILGPRWTPARQAVLRASRIGLTGQVVQWLAAAASKPRLLLSASAIGYYGVQRQDDPAALTESSPPQPVFMSQLCQEWEAAAGRAAQYGVQVACTRFGLVLGHGGALAPMLLPVRLGVGGRMGSGRQSLSWVHIDDLVHALAWLARRSVDVPVQGAWNLTAPECTTQLGFVRTAARLLHRPALLPTPAWPVRLLLGEQADLLLEGQRVMPRRLQDEGFAFRYPTVATALGALL
ncbi:TIGR01777 family oxidoreductase [Pseudoduganella armeniaca]|uniref:TIGR01777 family protein n=1 Tax=Pseudoduganella armeniaca TaxID=2072590 RepID=A0A2R4CG12_9BURK|nr:TIGR01777 family oxidoreductase [Pseudoduganella armeniaca]AVR98601.1 TIGR01777 family protein [Pseudoduganella armeniaca]